MLKQTFRHIPGIGLKTEQRIWSLGIESWDDFLKEENKGLALRQTKAVRDYLELSQEALPQNPNFFTDLLTVNQHWRLFPHYRQKTIYLDIETTGLNEYQDHITSIATYDGHEVKTYVYGQNLDEFPDDIEQFDVLVTYNGKSFDVPMIERFFQVQLHHAHLDLRYILRNLGYSGGLKSCEKQLGLDRGSLDGVDGYFAVVLWQEYERSGNEKALETLLAYNIEDVVNLEALMVEAYNISLQKTPFFPELEIPFPLRPPIPFTADLKLVDELKRSFYRY